MPNEQQVEKVTTNRGKTYEVVASGGVYLRKDSSSDAESIKIIPYGETVNIDSIKDGWAHLTDGSGYVRHNEYTLKEK